MYQVYENRLNTAGSRGLSTESDVLSAANDRGSPELRRAVLADEKGQGSAPRRAARLVQKRGERNVVGRQVTRRGGHDVAVAAAPPVAAAAAVWRCDVERNAVEAGVCVGGEDFFLAPPRLLAVPYRQSPRSSRRFVAVEEAGFAQP